MQALRSFEDLSLRANLGDHLRVEDQSGAKVSGRLTRLTRDEMAIQTDVGERRFTRDSVHSVAVRGYSLKKSALIGAGVVAVAVAGAATGAVAACTGEERSECADASIMAGALGAGLGLAVGALMHSTTVVYPEPVKQTFIAPAISRDGIGIVVSRRW